MNLRFLEKLQPLAFLMLRLALGIIIVGHGYSKVFAIVKVHLESGLLGPNGYQLPLALASIAFALIFTGATVSLGWASGAEAVRVGTERSVR